MGKINWVRVFLCGLLAGLTWTVLSSILTALVGKDFAAAVPNGRLAAPQVGFVLFLFVICLVEGIWAMWLYAAIRPRYGPGPKTAAIVGFSWWIISSLIDVTYGSFGFFPAKALVGPMLASLPSLIIAVIVGAWLYKE
jgi:hypothetical protein